MAWRKTCVLQQPLQSKAVVFQLIAFADQRLNCGLLRGGLVFVHSKSLLNSLFAAPFDIDVQPFDLLIQSG